MSGRVSSAVRRLSTSLRRPWGGARGPDEPPVVRGWVPYLGCALPYGRDAPAFLHRCQQRHGDVFTVYLMGRRMTFLLDPRDYPVALRHGGSLSFTPISQEISTRAFGYTSIYQSGISEEEMRGSYAKYLRPGVMAPLATRLQEELARALAEQLEALPGEPDGWREADLFDLVGRCTFEAGVTALFGQELFEESVRQQFNRYDSYFARLVGGVPLRLLGTARQDREALVERLRKPWPAASAFVEERRELLARYVDDVEAARVRLSMMWASQANVIPAAFWTLAMLLEDAEGLATVRDEIDGLVERDDDGSARFGADAIKNMRYCDSAISEALRLSSGSTTIRTVLDSFTLELTGGVRCALREGDNLCMFPYLSHRDPEVFEDPEVYRFDRFYAPRSTRQFFKQGERLGFALMPFGGGETMCPGRFLALSEIKMLVTMLLADYEVERLPGQARPHFDLTRSGLGILPPVEPLKVRLRPRASAA